MVRVNKITDCMDLLAVWEHSTKAEQMELISAVIDTVGGYPKPTKKGATIEPNANDLGAFVCVSNVRNYARLGILKIINLETAYMRITQHLETALSLLTE